MYIAAGCAVAIGAGTAILVDFGLLLTLCSGIYLAARLLLRDQPLHWRYDLFCLATILLTALVATCVYRAVCAVSYVPSWFGGCPVDSHRPVFWVYLLLLSMPVFMFVGSIRLYFRAFQFKQWLQEFWNNEG